MVPPVVVLWRAHQKDELTICAMGMWVLTGDDDMAVLNRWRSILASAPTGGATSSVDCASDGGEGLWQALASLDLFGGVRVVSADNIDKLDDRFADLVCHALGASDAIVVARVAKVPAGLSKKLSAAGAVFENFPRPKGRQVRQRISEICRRHGVTLSNNQLEMLSERASEDLHRVENIAWQLSTVGVTRPSDRQLVTLLGSTDAQAKPWLVLEELASGDLTALADLARRLDNPVGSIAYLLGQFAAAARAAATGATTSAQVAAALDIPEFQARNLIPFVRLGPARAEHLLRRTSRADLDAKSGADAGDVLFGLLCDAHFIVHGG